MLGLKLINVSKSGPWISAAMVLGWFSQTILTALLESYGVYVACPRVWFLFFYGDSCPDNENTSLLFTLVTKAYALLRRY